MSIGVHASNNKNSDSEKEDNPPKVSEMKGLRRPVKPLYRNELDLKATIVSHEDSDVEDNHKFIGQHTLKTLVKTTSNG